MHYHPHRPDSTPDGDLPELHDNYGPEAAIPNDTFGAGFDGWPTFIAPVVSLVVFLAVAMVTTPQPDRPAPAGTIPVRAAEG